MHILKKMIWTAALLLLGAIGITYADLVYTETNINEEREIPNQQKVVRGSNVPVLTSHVGLNPRSKSGNEGAKPELSKTVQHNDTAEDTGRAVDSGDSINSITKNEDDNSLTTGLTMVTENNTNILDALDTEN